MLARFRAGFQVCPRCRRAAALGQARCARCGGTYHRAPGPPGQTQVFRRPPLAAAGVSVAYRQPRLAEPSLLSMASLLLLLVGLLVWRGHHPPGPRRSLRLPPHAAVSGASGRESHPAVPLSPDPYDRLQDG